LKNGPRLGGRGDSFIKNWKIGKSKVREVKNHDQKFHCHAGLDPASILKKYSLHQTSIFLLEKT
jgi:hypothetical protein